MLWILKPLDRVAASQRSIFSNTLCLFFGHGNLSADVLGNLACPAASDRPQV